MENRVSAIAVPQYDVDLLESAVAAHFSSLELSGLLRAGIKVLLKPNLLMSVSPARAVTTHPALVEAVVRVLGRYGIDDILLADSPGGPYLAALLPPLYAACGMRGVAERTGLHLNTDVSWQETRCEQAVLYREVSILRPVAEADLIINLPKLKTHAMTMLSGGVKNLFGCVPGLQKPELHFRFPEKDRFCRMLLDLSLAVAPAITIVDAVVSMEGDGPSGGRPRCTGMTFAARNVYALDLALCRYIGLAPESVPTVRHALADGLCPPNAAAIVWLGDGAPAPLPDFQHPSSKPLSFAGRLPRPLRVPLEWAQEKLLSPRPKILKSACIGCGKCMESCAPNAITIVEKKAVLEPEKCIRCFCCHEMCPVKAVRICRTAAFMR